jgi:aminomethyltransferase
MLNPQGGVIDDLIVYFRGPERYRMVVNAGTADKDLAWMRAQADRSRPDHRPRDDLAMIAVQGPEARALAEPLLPPDCAPRPWTSSPSSPPRTRDWFVGRTGYTGEDGFEIMLPAADAAALWRALIAAGSSPAVSAPGTPCGWRRA